MKLNAEQINKIKAIAEEYDFDYAQSVSALRTCPLNSAQSTTFPTFGTTETTPAKTFPVFAFALSSWLIVTLIITASIAL